MKFRVFFYCNTNQRNSFLTVLKCLIINSTQDRLDSDLFLMRYVLRGHILASFISFPATSGCFTNKNFRYLRKVVTVHFCFKLCATVYILNWQVSKDKNYELDSRNHANKKTTKGNISIFAVLEEK